MFTAAREAAKMAIRNDADEGPSVIQLESLPESYSLAQLYANISTCDEAESQEDRLQNILVLDSCLHHSNALQSREPRDDEHITQLLLWLSKSILPTSSVVSEEQTASNAWDHARRIARQKGTAGMSSIKLLLDLFSTPPSVLDPQILLSIIAFTSLRDPWTSSTSLSTATSIISKYESQVHSSGFIIDYVLQKFIRPIFSKSKRSEAITASGRKAMPSSAPPRRFDTADQDEKNKPWIAEVPYTVTIFEWAVKNSSTPIATANFNLFIPPLLTLLDTPTTTLRSRSLTLLSAFLPLLSQKLLVQTGLGSVFEDAITPTLMFLPSITPVDESVQLLGAAYEALLVLGWGLYGGDGEEKEVHFWDRVMRKGVLTGYAHASEYPGIVEVLLRSMGRVVEKMQVTAVKHLKDILPILSTTLTDPFAPSHPSLLLAAIKTLQTTMLNCWPRLSSPFHRIPITSALAICWTNICQAKNEKEGADALEEVKRELIAAGKLFVKAVEEDVDIEKELEPLFEVEDRLRVVFGIEGS